MYVAEAMSFWKCWVLCWWRIDHRCEKSGSKTDESFQSCQSHSMKFDLKTLNDISFGRVCIVVSVNRLHISFTRCMSAFLRERLRSATRIEAEMRFWHMTDIKGALPGIWLRKLYFSPLPRFNFFQVFTHERKNAVHVELNKRLMQVSVPLSLVLARSPQNHL